MLFHSASSCDATANFTIHGTRWLVTRVLYSFNLSTFSSWNRIYTTTHDSRWLVTRVLYSFNLSTFSSWNRIYTLQYTAQGDLLLVVYTASTCQHSQAETEFTLYNTRHKVTCYSWSIQLQLVNILKLKQNLHFTIHGTRWLVTRGLYSFNLSTFSSWNRIYTLQYTAQGDLLLVVYTASTCQHSQAETEFTLYNTRH